MRRFAREDGKTERRKDGKREAAEESARELRKVLKDRGDTSRSESTIARPSDRLTA